MLITSQRARRLESDDVAGGLFGDANLRDRCYPVGAFGPGREAIARRLVQRDDPAANTSDLGASDSRSVPTRREHLAPDNDMVLTIKNSMLNLVMTALFRGEWAE